MIAGHTRSHIFNTPLGVVQPGSVLAWGASGRKFKSCHPDLVTTRVSAYC